MRKQLLRKRANKEEFSYLDIDIIIQTVVDSYLVPLLVALTEACHNPRNLDISLLVLQNALYWRHFGVGIAINWAVILVEAVKN